MTSTVATGKATIAGFRRRAVTVVAIAMSLFHLYTAGTLPFATSVQLSIHLAFGLTLVFLVAPVFGRGAARLPAMVDGLFIIAALVALGRILSFQGEIPPEVTAFISVTDMVLGALLVLLVLEAARRTVGLALPLVTIVFIVYALLGGYLPGILGHEGVTLSRLISLSYFSAQGIYGIPLQASSDVIFPLVLFGAFMTVMGSADVFFQLAVKATHRVRGGAALATVVSSAAMGTVTGSGLANATSTGVFTIPLMKRAGYRPHVAAAIEAAASSGSQIMPPVMGTTAFIMADLLNLSYGTIALAALVPGTLFFMAILAQVYLEACKQGIGGFPDDNAPPVATLFRQHWHLFIGPILLLYLIIVIDMSPGRAAFYSVAIVAGVDILAQLVQTRRVDLRRIARALEIGALTGAGIAAATAVIGLIIGALDVTGMSLRVGSTVLSLAGGIPIVLLFLTALFCLLLGAGLPTLLAYIVVAVTIAPALVSAGFPPLAAHMFVFYYAIIADITPPTCVTAVVAARIADAPPMRTAFAATRFSVIAFAAPFYFIYHPALLLQGTPADIAASIVLATLATILLAIVLVGYYFGSLARIPRLLAAACVGVFFLAASTQWVNLAVICIAFAILECGRIVGKRQTTIIKAARPGS